MVNMERLKDILFDSIQAMDVYLMVLFVYNLD